MTETERRTILCVDDEQDILDSLYDTFMEDYHVLITTQITEALRFFDENDIALVISDQRMPEMEGSKFLGIINEKKPICKKILLTGYSDLDAAIEAINLGRIDKYFSKPWDTDELKDSVVQLLSTYSVDQLFSSMMKDGKGLKSSLENAKKQSDLFMQFMNGLQTPYCIVDFQLNIQFINQAMMTHLKYKSPTDLQYNNLFDVLLTDISQTDFESRYIHNQTGEATTKLTYKTSNGASIKLTTQIIFNENDQFCGLAVIDDAGM
jgi:response regulator RpfG family c-di-GMP phosphodiesterase